MILLSIDPSLRRLGWASFDTEKMYGLDKLTSDAWNFGTVSPGGEGRLDRLYRLRKFFKGLTDVNHLILEEPSFYASTKGAIAAKEGYLTDLGIVLGMASMACYEADIWMYKPQVWKGSVSKEVTHAKLFRTFEDANHYRLDHDVVDAIMLLYFHLKTINIC
jgi:hypothetical protein